MYMYMYKLYNYYENTLFRQYIKMSQLVKLETYGCKTYIMYHCITIIRILKQGSKCMWFYTFSSLDKFASGRNNYFDFDSVAVVGTVEKQNRPCVLLYPSCRNVHMEPKSMQKKACCNILNI